MDDQRCAGAEKPEKGSDHMTARQPHRVRPLAGRVFIPNLPPLDSKRDSRGVGGSIELLRTKLSECPFEA